MLARALDLEVVVVEADDRRVREAGDLASRPTDTTANIEDSHAGLETELSGKVVLMPSKLCRWARIQHAALTNQYEQGKEGRTDSSLEGFAGVEAAEVERLGPAVLVELGGWKWRRNGMSDACSSTESGKMGRERRTTVVILDGRQNIGGAARGKETSVSLSFFDGLSLRGLR
jgi:hypothetical protein